ncbi:hypothetical protein F2Q70_00026120 [Brassica cretica]|nr:hypothetical protein F2Q70_00026120 [Brassica cretica]
MEAEEEEETQWQWSERRRRSSSTYKGKYTNRRETVLMDVNGLDMMMNGDETASSVAVLKPAMCIGQILSRKLLLANESAMMINGRVSLDEKLLKQQYHWNMFCVGECERDGKNYFCSSNCHIRVSVNVGMRVVVESDMTDKLLMRQLLNFDDMRRKGKLEYIERHMALFFNQRWWISRRH